MKHRPLLSGINAIIAAVLFVVLESLVSGPWLGAAAVAAVAPGASLPDMLFHYEPSALGPMFAALGEAGRAAYLRMNAVDFFFAASYGLLFLVATGWAARRLFPAKPGLAWLGAIGILGAAADEAENVAFRLVASGALGGDSPAASFASAATSLKFLCFYAASGLLAAAIIALIARSLRGRRRART